MALTVQRKQSVLPRWTSSDKDGSSGPPLMGQMRHLGSSSSQPQMRRSSIAHQPDRRRGSVIISPTKRSEGLLPPVNGKKSPEDLATAPTTASASTPKAPVADLQTQAYGIARRHNLDYHEVHYALKALEKLPRLPSGGMKKNDFETFLMRLFEVRHIPEEMLRAAYRGAKAESGPVDIDSFFLWYRDNMFTSVAAMTASADKQESNALVDSLARKHNISSVDLDKIKKRFDQFDTDKSGEIEFDEFELMMGKLLGLGKPGDLPRERLERFWKEIDKDGSGSVDFSEFTEWYLKYFSNSEAGGPLQAFYASFSPDVQRRNTSSTEAANVNAPAPAPAPQITHDETSAALARLAAAHAEGGGHPNALIDSNHRRQLLRTEVSRRTTVE